MSVHMTRRSAFFKQWNWDTFLSSAFPCQVPSIGSNGVAENVSVGSGACQPFYAASQTGSAVPTRPSVGAKSPWHSSTGRLSRLGTGALMVMTTAFTFPVTGQHGLTLGRSEVLWWLMQAFNAALLSIYCSDQLSYSLERPQHEPLWLLTSGDLNGEHRADESAMAELFWSQCGDPTAVFSLVAFEVFEARPHAALACSELYKFTNTLCI